MFRKLSKRKPVPQRRSVDDDNDDDDEEDALAKIQQTQQKHKLLEKLPLATSADQPKKKRKYLVSPTTATSATTTHPEQLSILEQKHLQAMEEFVQRNLVGADQQNQPNNDTTIPVDAETALYQELAASTVQSQHFLQSNNADSANDDKGAILVGGTGIAEVILPKAKRPWTGTANETEEQHSGIRYSRNPQRSSAVPGGTTSTATSKSSLLDDSSVTILPAAGFRSMVPATANVAAPSTINEQPPPHKLPLPAAGAAVASNIDTDNDTTRTLPTDSSSSVDAAAAAVDESRPGFAALFSRRSASSAAKNASSGTATNKPRGQQYQRDQEAFSKFIKRQRESGGKR